MENYKVYITTNANGIVTAIDSSAFVTDSTGWIEIDNGTGDRCHHAQGNYLPHGLRDEHGIYNYKYVDGELAERTPDDKAPEMQALKNLAEIAQLKQKLAATDYVAAKIAEGAATAAEYADVISERQEWRERINALESVTE